MEGDWRDWKEYNEKLIRRGEILLDLDFLKDLRNRMSETVFSSFKTESL
jgi:uncharacterized beta-barrel protein YwiB (DUF1934 family)